MRTFCDRPRFVMLSLLLFPLFAFTAGCGSGGSVSGKVTYKGKPVTRGTVQFFPEGQGGNYTSMIESDGSYSIPKIPPGPAKITVIVGRQGPPPGVMKRMGGGPAQRAGGGVNQAAARGLEKQKAMAKAHKSEGADSGHASEDKDLESVPDKYATPDQSGLKFDVTGGKQTFDIKLE